MSSWFDIVVLILLTIVFIKGYRKGMIKMLIELAIILCATFLGGKLSLKIYPYIESMTNMTQQWISITSYIISFLIIAAVLSIVGHIIQKLIEIINLTFINRTIGGVISMAISMIILSIVLNIILILDSNNKIINKEVESSSFFYQRVQSIVPAVIPYLDSKEIDKIIPENIIEQIESINSTGIIDSSYQRLYFKTDSIK